MEPRLVADDAGIGCLELSLEANIRGERGTEQLERLCDHALDRHRDPFGKAAATEAQDAVYQSPRTARRMHDVIEVAAQRAPFRRLLLSELAIADDGSEDIV